MNEAVLHRHSGASVCLRVEENTRIPIKAFVQRTEVEYAHAVAVVVGPGLPAENMDCASPGDNIRPPDFLSGTSDADWSAPGRSVVC
ncbi:hypothetical protein SDC9_162622 [bioreactor metagenome]|uniref:Uncharacterized protein n=1 Tax=bioreactor metagenome TaxID=1076179 RepID=A0A645FNY2_9ZZZZ